MINNNDIKQDLLPVSIDILSEHLSLSFDVYLRQDEHFVLYAAKNLPISARQLSLLRQDGVVTIYVPREQTAAFRAYMQSNISNFAQSTSITVETKAKLVYTTASDIMQDLFDNPESPQMVTKTKGVAHVVLDQITGDRRAFASLMKVSSYDYYTYTHCVNVCVYTLGIARSLGLDKESMRILGEGSILHDIGKSHIDLGIVNKPGPLTDDEFTQMKQHSAFGYDILSTMGESDTKLLDIVRQHHEKLDGTGYPKGLAGDEISFFAQIVAVADVFDALTTRRSYKEPLSSFQAFRVMKNKMDGHLNTKILDSFIASMQG
jgi:putative nucleotidyltransferase with HDIG domain